MNIKPFESKVWLSSPTMHGPEMEYMKNAFDTNWMSTVGENINEVEKMACRKVGCGYAVALSAGTAALHMAVKLAGVRPGDKVFCSDMTFDATVNPVVYEGGIPVFIDTEYGSGGSGKSISAVSGCESRCYGPPVRNTGKAGRTAENLQKTRRGNNRRCGRISGGIL